MRISKAAITSFSLRRPHTILTANLIIVVTIQRSSFILLLKPLNNSKEDDCLLFEDAIAVY